MEPDRPVLVRCAKVVAVYLLVLGLVLLFWASIHGHWAGGFVPIHYRLLAGLWQATGPFAFLLMGAQNLSTYLLSFLGVWCCWLAIVAASPLRNWYLAIHFTLGMLWCAVGFMPPALQIT